MSELTPEEEALLAAETDSTPKVEEAPAEEPKKRGRKPRAAETDVEPAEDEPTSEPDPAVRVIPAQYDGDPWGDTPVQSRF